jgi:phosphoribosylanthranilate isomerase
MALQAKICGINSRAAVEAAVAGGAHFVGFVFYPPSPRAVDPAAAAMLCRTLPSTTVPVGLFVDAVDVGIAEILDVVPLRMLQLHGKEDPERVREIRERFALPVMKAIKVSEAVDLAAANAFVGVADRLLFDSKPPPRMTGALPGGNALAFDWPILSGRSWPLPWMLSGGLTADNLAEAVRITGARMVDVSSGVEDRPGMKSPAKIAAFLARASEL